MPSKLEEMRQRTQKSRSKMQESFSINNETRYKDERYWKLTIPPDGNGAAIIRFLPPALSDGDDINPYVLRYEHAFKNENTGQWYIEGSRTTLGRQEKDPVSEYNSMLWNAGEDTPQRNQARAQARKKKFIANILVIKDPANPENEGKVFLYKFGPQILEMIRDVTVPDEDDLLSGGGDVIDPFCMFGPDEADIPGANFQLRTYRKKSGFITYDKSKFSKPVAAAKSDDEMSEIIENLYSIRNEIAPETFKSYDALKTRLETVLGHSIDGGATSYEQSAGRPINDTPTDADDDEKIPFSSNSPTDALDDDDEFAKLQKELSAQLDD